MKEKTNFITENINNLTTLWKTVGTPFNAYFKSADFEYCEIKNSEWPNRLWFNQPTNQKIIDVLKNKAATTEAKITFPIWNLNNKDQQALLEQNGFKLKFEQIAMCLKPNDLFEVENTVKIELVTNQNQATLWSDIFLQSFKYTISTETINKTLKNVDYYLAYHNNIAVGTAIIFNTNNVAGIHSVGIPPAMRRKGYAAQIMKLLINKAIKNQAELITLQASNMGKNIYLNLGFKEQFLIKNYILDQ
ncbi:ribosomal protein S18 acetylase RimI-like enzyme [Wenyingzhuangia heitensis]|uniref:Ribosomal protein S18 acetylase RimI-like enzyme n=1 Tax=Wenyingzhuangia heitensis TaxID=1487859 RepID=A0ABX0UCM5_9FLAO|nr:GNAT family N-acetyltransferase [Wenyingzhuangia heitensis]NIJ45221.1 ribosomal protein S18 acetylase RimI-like enzyme [Wenyingzhuangia heitensis]